MRITFIDTHLDLIRGGGSRYSLDVTATELVNRGYEISVITLASDNNRLNGEKNYKIIEERKNISPLTKDINMTRAMMKYSPNTDIFHIYDPTLLIGGAIYKFTKQQTPVIGNLNSHVFCTYQGLMDGECHKDCNLIKRIIHSPVRIDKKLFNIPYRVYQQIGFNLAKNYIDYFTADSNETKKIYSEFGFNGGKISVVPEVIDLDSLHRHKNKGLMKNFEKVFNILYVGRLAHNKGIDLLIHALSQLSYEDIKLHIVGGNEKEVSEMKDLANKLNVAEKVIFHGYIANKELGQFYEKSQIFVHPARWPEPFGRTIVEAMSFGLPIITSNVGAPKWIAKGCSLVFKRENVDDLRKKIEEIYLDIPTRMKFSLKAKKRAQKFEIEHVINELVNVYDSIQT